MGVPRIIPLVKNNPSLWDSIPFRDIELVVDGNCLMHFIYKHLELDTIGNYNTYAEKVEILFHWLLNQNITPYVVFDGAYEADDRKIETVKNRARQRIENPKDYAPILILTAFIDVLKGLNIKYVKCDFEADRDIQILANDLQCPVLSRDSDFYIFDVKFGYIPFDELPFDDILRSTEIESCQVQIYFAERLWKKFPYLKGNMALLATVMGNDYLSSDSGVLQKFYKSDNFKLPRCLKEDIFELKSQYFYKIIRSVLYWISRCKDVERGRRQLLPFCTKEEEQLVSLSIKVFSEQNKYSSFNLRELLQSNSNDLHTDRALKSSHNNIPSWVVEYHRREKLPNFIMNTLIHKRNILLSQLEGTNSTSSHECTSSLRQVIYAVLLGTNITVTEHDRKANKLYEVERTGVISVPGVLTNLENFYNLSSDLKTKILSASLCCSIPTEETFVTWKPSSLYLMIIAFWVRVAEPTINIDFVRSVLICYIYISSQRGDITDPGINNLVGSIVQESNEYAERQVKFYGYDSSILYAIAQLQSCIYFSIYLNKLLDSPLENVDPAHVFNGSIMHNTCYTLKNGDENFLKEKIDSNSSAEFVVCMNEILNFLQNNVYIGG